MASAASGGAFKFSLHHILDGGSTDSNIATGEQLQQPAVPQPPPQSTGGGRRRAMTPEEKRVARTCIVDGCPNYIVHRKRCFRHGGGKTCSVEGCNTSAKQRGLCWRHGGSILCNIDGCKRGVKSSGLCWTHGGSTGTKKQKTSSSSALIYSDDDSDDDSGVTEAAAATALAMSLRRAPARDHALSSYYATPPGPAPTQSKAMTSQLRSEFAVKRPESPALAALSRYCLFDDCRERPASFNGYSSSGFCAFHAKQVTQKNYVFEL